MTWEFPWKQTFEVYDTDGPTETTAFELAGVRYVVTPTKDKGIHTGRTRFKVECLTCPVLIHEATTGPSVRVRDHHRERHGGRTSS